MQQTVLGALEALQEDFVQFKSHQDSKIREIYPLQSEWEKKMKHLQESLQTTEERLCKMEVALKRPPVAMSHGGVSSLDHQAFTQFIRKGMDGIDFESKAMISQTETQGGFLVPPMLAELIQNRLKVLTPLRQLARVTSISGNSLDLLIEKGDAEVGWVAETDERPETKTPELAKLRIPVHQIYAKPKISQLLLDDTSFDIEHWLVEKVAEKMARVENQAFLFGDGDIKPRGILSYPMAPLGQGKWGTWEAMVVKDFAGTHADCFIEVFHALKAQYLPSSAWLMSRKTASLLRQLKDNQGQYLWQPSLSQSDPNMLMGYPVHFSDDLVIEAEEIRKGKERQGAMTILFGNFHEAYQIVDRSSIHVLRDPFSAKPYVEFYTTKRVSGDVINFDALKIIQLTEE